MNELHAAIRAALESAYATGKAKGQSIVLQLASGEMSTRDLEKHLEGEGAPSAGPTGSTPTATGTRRGHTCESQEMSWIDGFAGVLRGVVCQHPPSGHRVGSGAGGPAAGCSNRSTRLQACPTSYAKWRFSS